MGNMILCCGLSGSGKTTFCKKFVQEHPNYLHLNVDDFYQVYNGAQVRDNEYEVLIMLLYSIHTAETNALIVIVLCAVEKVKIKAPPHIIMVFIIIE